MFVIEFKYYIYSTKDDFPIYGDDNKPISFDIEEYAISFMKATKKTVDDYYIKRVYVPKGQR